MAIVNGPLFSLDASGALGKALVYTKWKGRNVVREYVTPANPNTLEQIARRAMITWLNKIWQASDQDAKDSWAAEAAAKNYSTFNAMVAYNMDQQTDGDYPTEEIGAGPVTVTAGFSIGSYEGGKGKLTVNLSGVTAAANTYMIMMLWETGEPQVKSILRLAAAIDGNITGAAAMQVSNVPPGSYQARVYRASNAGDVGSGFDATGSMVVT